MKKTTGYSINFAENTITLTKAFAQRAKNPGFQGESGFSGGALEQQ